MNVSVQVHLSKMLGLHDILSLFSCNRVMCLYKIETYAGNHFTFKVKETNVC